MDNTFLLHLITIFLASVFAGLAQKFANGKEDKYQLNKLFFSISFLILFVMMGFRSIGVGVDDKTYERIYNQVIDNGPIQIFLQTTMEPGYLILNYIISLFTSNFQYALVILTFIPMVFYYKALYYERKNINMFLGVFLFGTLLYIYFYGIIRLFIAASIVTYAYKFIFLKETKKYILAILIATLFHYSAIFMLFFVYITTEKEQKPRSIKSIIFLVIFVMPIIIFIASNYIFPNMGDRYNSYTQVKGIHFSIDLLDKIPILMVALTLYKDMLNTNKNIRIYLIMCSLVTIVSIYSTAINIGRIQWYLMFSLCIILPTIVRTIGKTKFKYFNILIVPVILLYGIVYMSAIYNQPTNKCMHDYSNILIKGEE